MLNSLSHRNPLSIYLSFSLIFNKIVKVILNNELVHWASLSADIHIKLKQCAGLNTRLAGSYFGHMEMKVFALKLYFIQWNQMEIAF